MTNDSSEQSDGGEGPFIGGADRPDLSIDPKARLADLTVEQLAMLIGPSGAISPNAGIVWKPFKDFKDTRKDFKDGKDIIDTGSPILKEAKEIVEGGVGSPFGMPPAQPPADPDRMSELLDRLERLERRINDLDPQ